MIMFDQTLFKPTLSNIEFWDKLIKGILQKKVISHNLPIGLLVNYMACKSLKKKSVMCRNLKDYVNLALNYIYPNIKFIPSLIHLTAQQIESEIYQFCKLIIQIKPKVILEIGTLKGGSLFLLAKLSTPDSIIISIDLPSKSYNIGWRYIYKYFFKSFIDYNQKMIIIKGDSHNLLTLKKVKEQLKNNRIDILFIDGDHSYNGVKKDFEMYSPLVKDNGIIAFHDIVENTTPKDSNVNRFWNEIKNNYEYIEFVDDYNQIDCGIGILIKKKQGGEK